LKKDPRVDAYIAKAAAFAQPILKTLRAAIHEGAPDVAETMRWSMPSFDVAGKPFCHVAAFKAHCRFVFWTGVQTENHDLERFGSIKNAADLPSKKDLVAVVRNAAKARAEDATANPKTKSAKTPAPKKAKAALKMPADFSAALGKNKKTLAAFEAFSPSHKREYIAWILEAKREETRATRIAKATDQIASGKSLNWKYM
jgi:uncharacterized protein YdeI (YjbR/CyaY-like superfamily)